MQNVLLCKDKRFQIIFNSVIDAIFVHPFHKDGFAPFIEVNDIACERYGYSKEEFLKLTVNDISKTVHDKKHAKADYRKILFEKRKIVFETIHIKKSGETFPVEINSNVIELEGQTLIFGVARDITERKLAEKALRETEERYRSIFLNNHAVMLVIDPKNGDIVDANPAAASFYGYSIEKLRRKKITQINTLPEKEVFEKMKFSGRENRKHLHFCHRLANGEFKDVEVYTGPITMHGKVLLFSIVHDVTEHKQAEKEKEELEARLKHTEKMESIGTLAGGIAHEFNNILGIIMGNTELAIDEVQEMTPVNDYLEDIQKACFRAKDIVSNILTVAHKSSYERKPITISSVIKESLKLIRSTTPAMIEIRQNIECEDNMVLGDVAGINQILINLCNNAVQAIGDNAGVLEVNLEPIAIDKSSSKKYDNPKPGEYVKLVVRDSGKGIDPRIKGRIFDPYFSTSNLAERTGMGLAIAHGIVKKHEGAIRVDSDVGKGTTFEVLFPVIMKSIEKEPLKEMSNSLNIGKKKVLVVDDEKSLLMIMEQMLLKLGLEVESKSDSLEALEIFKSDPTHFDLVITDIGMPNMSGDKLAEEIMKVRDDIPIIVNTGYSEHIDEKRVKKLGINGCITKPIVMKDLANVIRNVFNKKE